MTYIFMALMCLSNPPPNMPSGWGCYPIDKHIYSTLEDCQHIVDIASDSFGGYDKFCVKKQISTWEKSE